MPPPRRPLGPLAAALRVARKELLHGLRDRQTLVYVVVLPLCLYPVLFWLIVQGVLLVQGRAQHTEVRLALAAGPGEDLPAGLEEALAGVPADPPGSTPSELLTVVPVPWPERPEDPAAWRAGTEASGSDALLLLGAPPESDQAPARLFHESTRPRSELARKRVEARLASFARGLREAAAGERGRAPEDLVPFDLEERALDEEAELGAYVLSFLLPLLLVIATVLGAFVPAVDMTAGEHERGTAETTLLLPAPRIAVHLGKVLAITVGALLATALNLLALGLSAQHLLGMLGGAEGLRIDPPLGALLAVLPLAVLFAFMVGALLAGVASLARTFKEGQALLGPVQMVFILPALAGVIPGLELTPGLALVPVVNVVLAFRVLIRGEFPPLELGLTALSMSLVALLSVALCVRLLSRESALVSTKTISPARLLSLLRGPGTQR